MQIYGTFTGYEQRTNVTRLFKIYATDEGLLGGWIAPCDHEELLARFSGHGIGQQHIAGAQQAAQSAEKWEYHYDEILPDKTKFLEAHQENFAFAPQEIAAALSWKLKFIEKASTRFGALDITPNGSKKRRFYLVGRHTPAEVAALVEKSLPLAIIEGGPLAGEAFTPLDNASQPTGQSGSTEAEPVYKKPNWAIIIASYIAAILFSLVVASQFDFWLPLAACVIAPMFYKMLRFGGIAANYHSNSAEQLKRDRAARDAKR
jgi:hypothetical protein